MATGTKLFKNQEKIRRRRYAKTTHNSNGKGYKSRKVRTWACDNAINEQPILLVDLVPADEVDMTDQDVEEAIGIHGLFVDYGNLISGQFIPDGTVRLHDEDGNVVAVGDSAQEAYNDLPAQYR